MADKILTFNGKTISGPSGNGMAVLRGDPDMTIRFKFTNNSPFDPTESQTWSKGTWAKVDEGQGEEYPYTVWDWTYSGHSVAGAFKGAFEYVDIYEIEIVSLECSSGITDVTELFMECNMDSGIMIAYNALRSKNVRHERCFTRCGLMSYENYNACGKYLPNIPVEWGGCKPLTGNGCQIGDYIWSNQLCGMINIPGIVEVSDEQDYEPGTIGYYKNASDGNYRYTPAAIKYMIDHPEVLPVGWHIPTREEAENIDDYLGRTYCNALYDSYGNNGLNIGIYYDDYEERTYANNDGVMLYSDYSGGWYYDDGYGAGSNAATIMYLCDGNYYMYSDTRYGGDLNCGDYDNYLTETGYLYTVRLVRDHD